MQQELADNVNKLLVMMRACLASHAALQESQQLALESHAILQEGQRRLESSADRVESGQLSIRQRLVTILQKTDAILGVTTRTHTLVSNFRQGKIRALLHALFLDEWLVLYLYIALHPFAPHPLEFAASVWQYVLFIQRLWWLPADMRSGKLLESSIGGCLLRYFTSPWKALFLLHWVNHAALQLRGTPMYAMAFPGIRYMLPALDAHAYAACSTRSISPLLLSCVARATVLTLIRLVKATGKSLAVPGLLFQLGQILDLEASVLGWIWALVSWALHLLFWRLLMNLGAWGCGLELHLGRWIGVVRPFAKMCVAAGAPAAAAQAPMHLSYKDEL